jgi:hypothetical protein
MSSQPYAAIDIFSDRLNKKYIGQFSYRVGNPVRYPPFIAQFVLLIARIVRYFHIPALLDIHGEIHSFDINSTREKHHIRY